MSSYKNGPMIRWTNEHRWALMPELGNTKIDEQMNIWICSMCYMIAITVTVTVSINKLGLSCAKLSSTWFQAYLAEAIAMEFQNN